MNVSLTPQLEALVKKKLASGLYNSASEVIREALRLLEEQDQLRQLRLKKLGQEVRAGVDQLDRDQATAFDEKAVEKIKENGRKRLRSARRKKSA